MTAPAHRVGDLRDRPPAQDPRRWWTPEWWRISRAVIPPGVQADDHRVQPAPSSSGPWRYRARRERAGPVPGHHWSRRGPPRSRWSWSWSRPRALAAGRCRRLSLLIAQVLGQLGPQAAPPEPPRGRAGSSPRAPVITGLSGVDLLEQAVQGPGLAQPPSHIAPVDGLVPLLSRPQSASVLPSGLTQTIEHAQPRFVRASFRRHQEYQPRPGGNGPGPWPAGRDMSGPVRPRPRAVISAYHRLCGIEKSLAHVQVRPESTPHLPSPTPVHRGPPNLTQALNNIHHDTE